jgi:hypothetical protein
MNALIAGNNAAASSDSDDDQDFQIVTSTNKRKRASALKASSAWANEGTSSSASSASSKSSSSGDDDDDDDDKDGSGDEKERSAINNLVEDRDEELEEEDIGTIGVFTRIPGTYHLVKINPHRRYGGYSQHPRRFLVLTGSKQDHRFKNQPSHRIKSTNRTVSIIT